jgi:peptidoglycan/LPS O-acetylase OafA/YrhL
LGRFDRIFHPAAALLVFPVLVLAAATHAPRYPRLAQRLGQLSYPLYAIHFPVIVGVNVLQYRGVLPFDGAALALLKAGLALVLAWLAWRFYETPVRAALRRALVRRDGGESAPAQ